MQNFKAIVLRNYFPEKQKLILLDEQLGHIEVICKNKYIERVCNGSLIFYQRDKLPHGYFIVRELELLYVPSLSNYNELVFFHQLLELTKFFAPIEGCTTEIFSFLFGIYKKNFTSLTSKKLALCQLLYLLGVYPENGLRDMRDLFFLISSSADIMLNENANEQAIDDLDTWLATSIALHPSAHKLKSITFML